MLEILTLIVFIVGASLCLLILYMLREGFGNRVIHHKLVFNDFPLGYLRIFFISDIHRRKISEKLLQQVINKADIVVIGGDLLEKGVRFARVKENIRRLQSVAPTYFVWGNNDYEVDFRYLDAMLLDLGVKILDNTAAHFELEDGGVVELLGVDDMTMERDRLDLAIHDASNQSDGFRILVSHNPRIVRKVKKDDNIRLILSGHTHGGQIRCMGFGFYQLGGLHTFPDGYQLISNGYGTTKVPFRLGAKAEAHLITLSRE